MEVNINRKIIIIVTAILALVAGAAVAFWPNGSIALPAANERIGTRNVPVQPTDSDSTFTQKPEEATVAFAKAFYTVSYDDYDAWLAGLKLASTNEGYAILTKSIVPAVWPEIESAQTVTPPEAVNAEDKGLVLDGNSEIGGPWQIRNLNIHIDSQYLWPTMKSGDFAALIMLAKQDGQWRFVSFMTPEQIDQIKGGQ